MKNHMIDHRSYTHNINSCEIKPEKNSGLNGIRTHDFFPRILCVNFACITVMKFKAIKKYL